MTPAAAQAALLVALAVLLVPGRPRPRGGRPGAEGSPVRRRAGPADAALVLDLVAAVVEAGAAPLAAVRAVARVLTEAGSPLGEHLLRTAGTPDRSTPPAAPDPRPPVDPDELDVPLQRCLDLAEQTGAPVVALLRAAADEARRRRRRAASLAAARLGVRVVAPLGLCTLPAFALLAVLPVLLSLGRDLLG